MVEAMPYFIAAARLRLSAAIVEADSSAGTGSDLTGDGGGVAAAAAGCCTSIFLELKHIGFSPCVMSICHLCTNKKRALSLVHKSALLKFSWLNEGSAHPKIYNLLLTEL
jgi:hypothetical protein